MTLKKSSTNPASLSESVDAQLPLAGGGGGGADVVPALPENISPEMAAYLEALVQRRLQSAQDKRLTELEKQNYALLQQVVQPSLEKIADPVLESVPDGFRNGPAATSETTTPASFDVQSLAVAIAQALAAQSAIAPIVPNAGPAAAVPPAGGLPRPDLQAEYQRRKRALRPGDLNGLMALKREFRGKGLEVF